MHELQVARNIIEIVTREMTERNLSGVREIGLRLGALSGVNAEALSFGFEAATLNTALEGARLEIKLSPAKARCKVCKKEFEIRDWNFACPQCESTDTELTSGEELEITHIVQQ
jgi:hydrogenase nickel incorporation protein HypA/HybF